MMLIRTQNKKGLLKIASLSITRNYGGKLKFAIIGIVSKSSLFDNTKILGLYKTESDALQELDKYQNFIQSNSKAEVYQMS